VKHHWSLSLLLHAEIGVVTALALTAVHCLDGQGGVASSANLLFYLVFSGEGGKGGFNLDLTETTTAEAEHQVKGGLLLDVVVGKGAAVFELLAGEDEALLVWGNALLILNLGLNVLNGVAGLDVQSDRSFPGVLGPLTKVSGGIIVKATPTDSV